MDEHNSIKPKRRWFQFGLKTLLLLPVVAGIGTYWYDWRQYRPPIRDYDDDQYCAAFKAFAEHLKAGNMDHAYESTSVRFKQRMSRSQFEALIGNHPTVAEIEVFEEGAGVIHALQYNKAIEQEFRWINDDEIGLRNWMTAIQRIRGRDGKAVEIWVWIVMDDSFFHRRPPLPQVEEVQVREIDGTPWRIGMSPSNHHKT